jgi:hypothetical protein
MTYYFVINEQENTFNIFDELNLEYIPKGNKFLCKIEGDENCNQVIQLIYKLRPNLKQVNPFII